MRICGCGRVCTDLHSLDFDCSVRKYGNRSKEREKRGGQENGLTRRSSALLEGTHVDRRGELAYQAHDALCAGDVEFGGWGLWLEC